MNNRHPLLVLALAGLFASTAQANVVTFAGNTASGSTYNRLDVDPGTGLSTGLSTISGGTAVNYNVYGFSATAGTYNFLTAGAFDTYTFLYGSAFDPLAPITNALIGNDDLLAGIGTSGFSLSLAGGTYLYVTTALLNGQNGFFSTAINGNGTITPISTPAAVPNSPRVATFTGTTSGAPTYDRADDASTLSGIGDAVGYKTYSFRVGSPGTYGFESSGDYDTFLSLYAGGFNPANALGNLVTVDDDYFANTSAFARDLVPGVTYTLVTSAYSSGEAGSFSNAITGPGAITQVPEPATVVLLLSGFGALGFVRRRRGSGSIA